MFRHHRHGNACTSRGFSAPDDAPQGRFARRRRMFDQGDLRFVILQLIADKPSHGYEIIKAIEEKVAGAYSPSPGIVYPTLTLLEELGLVTVADGPGTKKLYSVTDEGRATLGQNRPAIDAVFARMAEISATFGEGPAPQILRAAVNLRTALKLRLSRGALTEAQIATITATLDQAAIAIEGS